MNTQTQIKIIVADDHPMFRDGVKQALSNDPSLHVVAVASDGEQALRLIKEHSPDIAVLDMNMPKMTGLNVLKELKKAELRTEVVFLTMFDDEEIFNETMDLGVKGYILKESASIDIVNAVRSVHEGRHYLSPALTDKLLKRKEKKESFSLSYPQLQTLTEQERRILKMIADSKTSKEIADTLFLSQKTIDNYRFKISEKLELSGSYSLLKFALENKALL
jgi:DNA-binding NarL/FixJ family response regulator